MSSTQQNQQTHRVRGGSEEEDGHCTHCGWMPELPHSHVEHGMDGCPYIASRYVVWIEDGEVKFRVRGGSEEAEEEQERGPEVIYRVTQIFGRNAHEDTEFATEAEARAYYTEVDKPDFSYIVLKRVTDPDGENEDEEHLCEDEYCPDDWVCAQCGTKSDGFALDDPATCRRCRFEPKCSSSSEEDTGLGLSVRVLQAAIDAEVDEVEADTGLPIDAPVGVWFDAEHERLHYFVYGMSKGDSDAVFEFFDKEPWCYMSRTTCDGSCCEFCRGKQSFRDHIAKYSDQPPPAEAPAPSPADVQLPDGTTLRAYNYGRDCWLFEVEGPGPEPPYVYCKTCGSHVHTDEGNDRIYGQGPGDFGFEDTGGGFVYCRSCSDHRGQLVTPISAQAQAEDQDTGLGLSDRGGSEEDVVEWVEFEGVEMSVSDGRQRYQDATADDAARLERFEDELVCEAVDFVCEENVNRRNRWFDFLRHRGMSYAVADVELSEREGVDIAENGDHFGVVMDLLKTFEATEGQD